ncbi:hypothetical protein ILYODFUR_022348 [Ilyodon furcidens]|uniref:Uncharacterized protein n=1 Tax=Ilyodon furcidens TaxID=33524 RepID=A0ABV0SNF1_9TELE
MGERRGTPSTGILTQRGNLERPINLTVMFLDCGRMLEYRNEPPLARGEHAKSMPKDPRPAVEPNTFLLQGNSATSCTTAQLHATTITIQLFQNFLDLCHFSLEYSINHVL